MLASKYRFPAFPQFGRGPFKSIRFRKSRDATSRLSTADHPAAAESKRLTIPPQVPEQSGGALLQIALWPGCNVRYFCRDWWRPDIARKSEIGRM